MRCYCQNRKELNWYWHKGVLHFISWKSKGWACKNKVLLTKKRSFSNYNCPRFQISKTLLLLFIWYLLLSCSNFQEFGWKFFEHKIVLQPRNSINWNWSKFPIQTTAISNVIKVWTSTNKVITQLFSYSTYISYYWSSAEKIWPKVYLS